MTSAQSITLTIDWRTAAAELPPEIQEQQTQNLYRALREIPEVEQVDRIADPNVPDGAMGAAWLKGLLLTKVIPGNLEHIFKEIKRRILGTPISFEIEVVNENGQKKRVKMDGVRPEELDAALDKLKNAAKELSGEQP
jgi:hypothetical protein